MGIKRAITKAVGKAGDAVAKASSLSPEQLEEVQAKRDAYLSQMPDYNDPAAVELTHRLIASCGVEIFNAYLPQIEQLYSPIDPSFEYGKTFDSDHNIRFFRIAKWVVNPEESDLEKLINVYNVLSRDACNIALVFNRTKTQTNVYLAVADTNNSSSNVNADNYKKRLCEAIRGNFPGSEVSDSGAGRIPCLNGNERFSVATVSNIPAEKSEKFISQTIEKLLDGIVPSRRNEEYTLILLATPIADIEERKLRLAELYTALAPYAGWQTKYDYSENDAAMSMATVGINAGVSAGSQRGTNSGIADNNSFTESSNDSVTETHSESRSDSISNSKSTGTNESISAQAGFGPVSASIYGGTFDTEGVANTKTRGTSTAKSVAKSLGKAATRGVTTTSGIFNAINLGANFGASFSRASSVTATVGKSEGITQSFTNYTIKHTLEILEAQMKRLDQASALSMWDFAAYVLSEDADIANNVAHSYLALTQGEESYMSQASVNIWRGDLREEDDSASAICEYLRDLRHPLFGMDPGLLKRDLTFAVYPSVVAATTALSGKELAFSLNFPRKSVAGLPVIECAAFGRNISTYSEEQCDDQALRLGKIFHMHHEENLPVELSKNSLASHTFITGSTGSGKTNTVCKIIDEAKDSNVTFLVIEPAKGEYKEIYGGKDGVSVFGTNPSLTPLLKINPFSFPSQMHVLEHLDRLIEIFNVCWPMYAAMPAVLKAAVERSYEDCGWNLTTSTNEFSDDIYPSFSDVARNVKEIINSSEYDTENKGAYKGSLLTRLESLTNGINGMILSDKEIEPAALFDNNAIVDLSRVGSAETKSLLMGLLLLKLQEHRLSTSKGTNLPLTHITVLEEAHNILKRTPIEQSSETSNLLGKSVEMLSNAIAEMRTYGEGFIIADQAPGLLDMAAIRNTNTKIIMRLPDLSDRELVGKAAGLNDAQIIELAKLPRGVAAIYQNNWIEPVLCKVDKASCESSYSFRATDPQSVKSNGDTALRVMDLIIKGTTVEPSILQDLNEQLRGLGIASSIRIAILRMLKEPSAEPKMTEIAPIASALFPTVKESVVKAVRRSKEPAYWTKAAESALDEALPTDAKAITRHAIIQGVMVDHIFNEKHDEATLNKWCSNNGMR